MIVVMPGSKTGEIFEGAFFMIIVSISRQIDKLGSTSITY